MPHPTTLMKLTTRCGSAAIDGLNEALLAKAAEAKLLGTNRIRADTTVARANVSYPTDLGLLAKAMRRIAATGKRHGEPVVQHERDPLIGAQPLQHHHGREPGVLGGHHGGQRIGRVQAGDHRFGQPGAGVGLPPVRRRPQLVQTQPAHHGGQPGPRVGDHGVL